MQTGAVTDPDTGDDPRSAWATNGELRLHYLDARPSAPGAAVVVLPGFGEEALDHTELLEALAPRRVIAVDLRGRGRSTVAAVRYRIEDHVEDLAAIIAASGIDRLHLVTYSRGTTYGLGWALAHLDQVASITIGDYPAAQIVPPSSFSEMAGQRRWKGRPMSDRMPLGAIAAMARDATAVEFWDALAEVRQPMLLIRGGARGAMVTDTVAERYRRTVRDLRVVTFEESGHNLWRPDPYRFPATVSSFLDDVERRELPGPAVQAHT
jgi:non-heme chloroperoxidase